MSEEHVEIQSAPCPHCGHQIPAGTTYCANCGAGTRPYGKPPKKGLPIWVWVLIVILALPLLCCGGCFVYFIADGLMRGAR